MQPSIQIAARTERRSGGRMGGLHDLSRRDITRILGVKPVAVDGDGKSTLEWRFTLEGVPCTIWNWYGSDKRNEWSWSGSRFLMVAVFGDFVTE